MGIHGRLDKEITRLLRIPPPSSFHTRHTVAAIDKTNLIVDVPGFKTTSARTKNLFRFATTHLPIPPSTFVIEKATEPKDRSRREHFRPNFEKKKKAVRRDRRNRVCTARITEIDLANRVGDGEVH